MKSTQTLHVPSASLAPFPLMPDGGLDWRRDLLLVRDTEAVHARRIDS